MKELSIKDLCLVVAGASVSPSRGNASSPSKRELAKECRDDIVMGIGAGASVGALTKNVYAAGVLSLVGGDVATKISSECQAFIKMNESNAMKSSSGRDKTGNGYSDGCDYC